MTQLEHESCDCSFPYHATLGEAIPFEPEPFPLAPWFHQNLNLNPIAHNPLTPEILILQLLRSCPQPEPLCLESWRQEGFDCLGNPKHLENQKRIVHSDDGGPAHYMGSFLRQMCIRPSWLHWSSPHPKRRLGWWALPAQRRPWQSRMTIRIRFNSNDLEAKTAINNIRE